MVTRRTLPFCESMGFWCRSEATRQPLASQVDEAAGALRALQRMEAGRVTYGDHWGMTR